MLQAYYPKSPFIRNSLVESQLIKRNPQLLSNLLNWLVQTPTVTTYRVNLMKTTCDKFQKDLHKILLQKYTVNPPTVFALPDLPEVVCIDSIQIPSDLNILDNNSLLEQKKEVIVDVNCGAALLRGAHLYAMGVLAMETNTRCNEEVLVYADLEGKCKRGTNVRYESAYKLLIGLGVTRMQRCNIYGKNLTPSGIAVEMLNVRSGVPSLGNLTSTDALLQNLPSIVCVRALNPQPGQIVLDMCAAPGNKTTHIAEMMRDEGVIIALDIKKSRVAHVMQKAETHGYKSIRCYAFDATMTYAKEINTSDMSVDDPPFAANTFDRILLDAPCSALGNRPVLSLSLTAKELQSFPKVQKKLIQSAVPLLKPHGTLIYSTCTVTEEENELMVAWALRKYPELQLVDIFPKYGGFGLRNDELTEEQRMLVQRFGSTSNQNDNPIIDTVGFFIAKFIKL